MKRHRSPRWSAWRRAAAAVVASVILQLLALAAPASADDCTPQCSGKFCGDDGCGGTCGECVGTACVAGKCPVDSTFIPKQGCCDGNRLVRPAGQLIVVSSCSGMPSCGWDPGAWDSWGHPGAYACGTDGGEDPAGNAPKPCVIDCAGLCFGKECGPSGCGSSCGSCESEEVCIEGTCCLPDCEGRECGDDGCGGSCGAECPVGQGCSEAGQCCAPDCVGRQCGTDGCGGTCGSCTEGICLNGVCIYGCSGVTLQGCCLGEDAARCSSGELTLTECSSDAACGWKPSVGGYFCYHGHGGEEDPSGTYPIDCEIDCSQNCLGKECGSDGCGEGTCGECPAGDICVGGQCCTPDCEGKECGPDGCGGDCWYCDPDEQEVCQDGTCVPSWGCKNTSTAGCPGCACEECVCALEPTCCLWEWSYGCALVCEDECGGCAACEPDCTGAVCGSDGCGGSCGGCPPGYGCSEGQCCEQACEGKACGPDGCGGTCGTCAPGAVCDADLQCVQEHGCSATDTPGCGGCACEDCACELDPYCCDIEWDMACVGICEEECGGCGPTTCVPSCGGKTCGPDGCGGSCGECPAGALCRDGQCCTPDCSDGCGGPDGCGGDCGPESCGLGSFCEEGECKSLCAEECEGLECGVGTCGGPCGTGGAGCPQGHQVCLDGTCYNDCAGISPLAGCCDGSIAVACVLSGWHSDVMTTECGLSCGWKPEYDIGDETETGSYECGPPTPDPSGVHPMACDWSCKGPVCDPVAGSGPPMECGPDGCGGTCGECGAGEVCTRGACCTADLGDRECGPDACGAIVECEAGFRCSSPGLCVPCDDDPCQGRECGPDGCGGWCGICGYAEICASGVCLASCEGLSEKGCCSGDIHVWCNDSGWVFAEKCGPGANYCGWAQDAVDADGNPGGAYQCNTDGGVEPSGEHPKECFDVCAPACWWKECGDDGCGGTCGECPAGLRCDNGSCVVEAVPDTIGEDTGLPDAEVMEPDRQEADDGRRHRGCTQTSDGQPGRGLFPMLLLIVLMSFLKGPRFWRYGGG